MFPFLSKTKIESFCTTYFSALELSSQLNICFCYSRIVVTVIPIRRRPRLMTAIGVAPLNIQQSWIFNGRSFMENDYDGLIYLLGNSLWYVNLRAFCEINYVVIQVVFSSIQNKCELVNKFTYILPQPSTSVIPEVGSNYSIFLKHQYKKGGTILSTFLLRSQIIANNFYFVMKIPSSRSLTFSRPKSPTLFSAYLLPCVCASLLFTCVPLSRLLRVNYLFIVNIILLLFYISTHFRIHLSYILIIIDQDLPMKKLSTQVMIAGCGPVGLTLANCLISSPYIDSIALLDRKIPKPTRQIQSTANQRVFSINGPSLKILQNIKALPIIRQKGLMQKIQVVSKQSLAFVNWSQNNANVIENDQLVYSLMSTLKSSANASKITYLQDQVEQITKSPQNSTIKLKNNPNIQIDTKLLVGSDGITSNIKKLAGISHYGWQYRQRGIVCTMKINNPKDNNMAYQIYHDGNVLALLPLWNDYVSLVWSVGIPDFQYLMNLDQGSFQNKLNNVIKNSNYYLRNKANYVEIPEIIEIVNKRLSFPLSTMQSSAYTQERIALVGDAAHTIHPMAGLGVNSGIMDSALLANNIIKNIKTGNDIGDPIALGQYEAKAKAFNYANSLAMETIKKSFQTDLWIVNKFRQFGMDLVQNIPMIKKAMKNAVDDESLKYQWETA